MNVKKHVTNVGTHSRIKCKVLYYISSGDFIELIKEVNTLYKIHINHNDTNITQQKMAQGTNNLNYYSFLIYI